MLLEAVRLNDNLADAHVALAEIYGVGGDYAAAERHARRAAECGNERGVEMLRRNGLL
jgi:Tfp pilus assembly protein PilF